MPSVVVVGLSAEGEGGEFPPTPSADFCDQSNHVPQPMPIRPVAAITNLLSGISNPQLKHGLR
jgi:hypothetical protein